MSASQVSSKITEQKVTGAQGLSRRFVDGKPSSFYRFSRMVGGTRVQKRFEAATVQEARDIAASLSGEIRTKGTNALGDRSVSIESLVEQYLLHAAAENVFAANTLAQRRILLRQHVAPALGPKSKAADIQPPHIRQMVSTLKRKGLAGSSVRACVAAASGLFGYAVKHAGILPSSPVPRWERGELPSAAREVEPTYLTVDEVSLVLTALSDEFRPVGATCFYAGLRITEALSLKWDDIDFEQGIVRVEDAATKTTASKQAVPLLPELAEELKAHRTRQAALGFQRIAGDALVFQTPSGLSPGRRNAHRAITNAAWRSKVVGKDVSVGPHDLRHSLAAWARENPALSSADVTRLLRHANERVTQVIYGGRSGSDIEQAVALGAKFAGVGA